MRMEQMRGVYSEIVSRPESLGNPYYPNQIREMAATILNLLDKIAEQKELLTELEFCNTGYCVLCVDILQKAREHRPNCRLKTALEG